MDIIESNLKFGSLSERWNTSKIILHHIEALNATVEDIHQWHLGNGWSGIGYHFYVRKDGSIYRGRPENTIGSHCKGQNSVSIGISFEGDYMKESSIPEVQFAAGMELISYLKEKYNLSEIGGHNEYFNTECPGVNFPINRFKTGHGLVIQQGFRQETKWLQILCNQLGVKDSNGNSLIEDGVIGTNSEYAIRHLPVLGIAYTNRLATKHIQNLLHLDADGIFGRDTANAVMVWQYKHGLSADGIVGANTWLTFA